MGNLQPLAGILGAEEALAVELLVAATVEEASLMVGLAEDVVSGAAVVELPDPQASLTGAAADKTIMEERARLWTMVRNEGILKLGCVREL